MGMMGACGKRELHAMKVEDVKFFVGCVQIMVPRVRTGGRPRNFTITDAFYDVVKKYADLRPMNLPCNSFFLRIQHGKCTRERIGINKFGVMGKEIAKFLGLPNPERYTGHCLRKSHKTLRVGGKSANASFRVR